MSFSEWVSPLIGRFVLAWFFLGAAWERASHWDATVQLVTLKDIPAPGPVLALALIVMVLGGLSLVFGYHARHAAMVLFGFTVIATVYMHDFWRLVHAADRAADYRLFAANVAIAGGLLILAGLGPGPFAMDNRGRKKN